MSPFASPYIVPVAGCAMILGLGVAGIYEQIKTKQYRAEQRMAMLSRGMSPEDVERAVGRIDEDDNTRSRDPLRSLANLRRSALILVASGVGLLLFGLLIAAILQRKPLLIIAASSVLPIAVGTAFWVDYRMQRKDLLHLGILWNGESDPGSGSL